MQYTVLSTCHNSHVRLFTLGLHPIQEAKSPMSMQEHLVELKARHRELEDEIADAIAHPSTDDAKIVELKRRKLQVKDEIARMQASSSIH
jgi:hypothetical protein